MDPKLAMDLAEAASNSKSAALFITVFLLCIAVFFLSVTIRRNRAYLEEKIDACERNHALCEKRLNRIYMALAKTGIGTNLRLYDIEAPE